MNNLKWLSLILKAKSIQWVENEFQIFETEIEMA